MAERVYVQPGQDVSAFVGVDPEYRTFASATEAPSVPQGEAGELQKKAMEREQTASGVTPAKPVKTRTPRQKKAAAKVEAKTKPEPEVVEPEPEVAEPEPEVVEPEPDAVVEDFLADVQDETEQ